jgi:hypothetical protein
MPAIEVLESAFGVYFAEMVRCRVGDTHWALLHVILALPDICASLESENGWATHEKYVAWCREYCPPGIPAPEDYRDLRNLVLHQGQTRTASGVYFKFTKPTASGNVVHRLVFDGNVCWLDVGQLSDEMIASIRTWFRALQLPAAAERRAHVAKHLPRLVTVKAQELPAIKGVTFTVTHTATGSSG